jgi:GNAT superfamily N-acetyltransferase
MCSIQSIKWKHPESIDQIFDIDDGLRPDERIRSGLLAAIEQSRCIVAEIDAVPVGLVAWNREFFGRDFVFLLFVSRQWRRRGIATALLNYVETTCDSKALFASTNESNAPMRQLMESCGYRPSGRIENLDTDDPELVFVKIREN